MFGDIYVAKSERFYNQLNDNKHDYFNSNSTVYSFDILSGKSLWCVKTKALQFYPGVHSKGRSNRRRHS